jgi:putative oxidoreductase
VAQAQSSRDGGVCEAAGRADHTGVAMNLGRLVLRLTIGSIFIEHGSQKLFGWFGGQGADGTVQFFDSIGLRPGRQHALAAGTAEAGCGLLLSLGATTPAAAAALSSVMITALRTVVWRDGIKVGTGGYEVLLLAGALALADLGPGDWSVDALIGTERGGPAWAAAALAAGVVGSSAAVALGRRHPPSEEPASASSAKAATPA